VADFSAKSGRFFCQKWQISVSDGRFSCQKWQIFLPKMADFRVENGGFLGLDRQILAAVSSADS
jgi:hypothetical protein